MKNTVTIEITVPREMLTGLGKSKQTMSKEMKTILALQLFKEGKISSGKAAELAGMPLVDFMDFTRRYKIPWIDYVNEELDEELTGAKRLSQRLKANRR